jgi:hypothetical protein
VTGLAPRAVWGMRLDEAVGYCLARAAMVKAARSTGSGQARSSGDGGYERMADGTIKYRIDSMDKLRGFLAGGVGGGRRQS